MDPAYPSFQLVEFIPPSAVTGRNCGAPLKTGMIFNVLRRTRFSRDNQHLYSEEVGAPRTISLKLKRIEAYRKTLDELGSGMTALLELTGDGLDQIREELANLPEREYLTIEAVT